MDTPTSDGVPTDRPTHRRAYRAPTVIDFGDVERLTNAVSQQPTVAD